MLRFRLLLTMAAAGLPVGFAERGAHAEYSLDECVERNVRAQELRREGKLAAARLELGKCSDASCPGLVRDDCARRLDEVDRAQPTIVFDVKDATGRDVVEVVVTVDGQRWAERLDGRAKPIDPGLHEFRFEAHGSPPASLRLLVREGESARRERIVLEGVGPRGVSAAPSAPQPTRETQALPAGPWSRSEAASPAPDSSRSETSRRPEVAPSSEDASRADSRRTPLAVSLAGAGLVGFGVGTVFGLMAMAAKDDAKAACGGDWSRCMDVTRGNEHKQTAETQAAVSTLAFVAGGLLTAAGVVVYLRGGASRRDVAAMSLAPSAEPGYLGLTWKGSLP